MRWRSGLSALLALVVVASACSSGGGGDDEASDQSPDASFEETVTEMDPVQPCDVLTPEAAGAAVGLELREGERLSEGDRQGCDFFTLDDEPVAAVFYEVNVRADEFADRIGVTVTDGTPITPVASNAHVSFWVNDRRVVVARLADAMIQVILVGPDFTEPEAGERAATSLLRVLVDAVGGGVAPPAGSEPEVVEIADVDHADLSEPLEPSTYVDHLLAGVDDGSWTLGEGLAEMLTALVDEDEETNPPTEDDFELSGLLSMAQAYVAEGDDDETRAEVEDALAGLVWSPEQLEAMVLTDASLGSGDEAGDAADDEAGAAGDDAARPSSGLVQPVVYSRQELGGTDCWRFSGGRASLDVAQCLARETFTVGGVEYKVYGPDPQSLLPDSGWRQVHYDLVEQAIRDSVGTLQLYGPLPGGVVVFSSTQAGNAYAAAPWSRSGEADNCNITLYPLILSLTDEPDNFKQVVSHEVGHCFQDQNVDNASSGYPDNKWMVESMAEYLSNEVYPTVNFEHGRHGKYRRQELSHTLFERDYDNASWVQQYANEQGGMTETIALLRAVSDAAVRDGDGGASAMEARGEMAEVLHEFARKMTEGSIADSGGGNWPRSTKTSAEIVASDPELAAHERELKPFGIDRFIVAVPAGRTATLSIRYAGDLTVSVAERSRNRPREWSSAGGSIELAADCDAQKEWFVLTTATQPAERQLLTFDVADVEETCEEETPEIIDAIDPCVVGTWNLRLESYLGAIKLTDVTRRDQASRIKGKVTITMRSDRTLTLETDEYVEEHSYGDGRSFSIQSTGTGDEQWGADGARLNAHAVEDSLSFETRIASPLVGESTLNAPPEHLFFFPTYQQYVCSARYLTVFFGDGFITSWER